MHAADLTPEYVPAAHDVHAVAPDTLEYVPAVQLSIGVITAFHVPMNPGYDCLLLCWLVNTICMYPAVLTYGCPIMGIRWAIAQDALENLPIVVRFDVSHAVSPQLYKVTKSWSVSVSNAENV